MEIDLPVVITAEGVQLDIDRDYEKELCSKWHGCDSRSAQIG